MRILLLINFMLILGKAKQDEYNCNSIQQCVDCLNYFVKFEGIVDDLEKRIANLTAEVDSLKDEEKSKDSKVLNCSKHSGVYYEGNCYKAFYIPMKLNIAESQCIEWGGHLTSVHSREEVTFVNSLVYTHYLIDQSYAEYQFVLIGTYYWGNNVWKNFDETSTEYFESAVTTTEVGDGWLGAIFGFSNSLEGVDPNYGYFHNRNGLHFVCKMKLE